jgi:hypothetical protein
VSYYPPDTATRDEILAWRNDRVREHNAAVEMVEANLRAPRRAALRIVPAAGEQPAHVVPLAPPPEPAIVELCDCGGCEDCRGRRRVAIERQAQRARRP